MTIRIPAMHLVQHDLGNMILHEGGYGDGHSTDGYGNGEGDGDYPIAYYKSYYGDGSIAKTMQAFMNGDGETRDYLREGM